jgi:hypothetical protein
MIILTINIDLAKDHYTEKIEENKRISYLIFLTLNLDNTQLFSVVLLSLFSSGIFYVFNIRIIWFVDFVY